MKTRPRGYWLRLIVFFVVMLYAAVIVALPVYGALTQIHPAQHRVCCETPADRGLAFENVEFATKDGITLRGWYIYPRNGAVVIALHGYGGDRLHVLAQAEMLARHGFGVLLYDQRASGESDGETLSWGWRDVADVSDAVTYLGGRSDLDPGRIGVYGCSTGAEVALAATALEPRLGAAAAEDAEYTSYRDVLWLPTVSETLFRPFYPLFITFMEWRSGASAPIALVDAVPRIAPRPMLLISNGNSYDRWQAEFYYEHANLPKDHWNLPESTHCRASQTRPVEFEGRLVDFFSAALLQR
jgi:pimeloyl-ACP methyl ester carboxylesterase